MFASISLYFYVLKLYFFPGSAVDPRGGWKEKYETWRDYTMPKLKLAAGRMMNRVTAGAFKTWHENALAAAEARLEEERRKLDRANRIIRRMMNRIVSDAFSGWHHAARAALEIKMKTKRAVMKMQRRQFAGAFSRYDGTIHDHRAV